MSNSQNKLQKDRNQKLLLELAGLPGNNICADCKARLPRWASHSLGIFLCVNCASIHRKIGTHITKVKSLTMDEWTKDQIEVMKSMGNIKSNSIYNPNETRNPPPPNLEETERDSEIEQYIRAKYEYRRFIDKSALAASKLGPSRSASTLTPRSVSSPLTKTSQQSPSSRPPVTATDAAASTAISPRIPPSSSINQTPQYPTSSSAYPQNPTRSVSQPVPPQATQHQQPQQQNLMSGLGSVWEDLNSLSSTGQNSSLPLQYQTTSSVQQSPHVNGAMGANGYPVGVTSAGMGMNPFQPQILGQNPFSPHQSQSPFAAPSLGSPFAAQPSISPMMGTPTHQPQSYGQQYFVSTTTPSNAPLMSQATSSTYFQPQAQSQASLQVQAPLAQGFMSSSPSGSFMPAPATQPQFLTPSPSQQFVSHSPQAQPAGQSQFMYQTHPSAQPQMQYGLGVTDTSGQSQFLGMTTMQMQQQQQLLLQQQQQQQQQQQLHQLHQQQLAQGMFSPNQPQGMYGQQTYPQGGYPTQGGQWGSM